jgi:hypothetical protein
MVLRMRNAGGSARSASIEVVDENIDLSSLRENSFKRKTMAPCLRNSGIGQKRS